MFWILKLNIDVCETLMPPPFPNLSRIGLTFDPDLWPTDLNIDRDHLIIMDYLPTKLVGQSILELSVAKS